MATVICAGCGKERSDTSEFCLCGTRLKQASRATSANALGSDLGRCLNCNKPNLKQRTVCFGCGETLPWVTVTVQSAPVLPGASSPAVSERPLLPSPPASTSQPTSALTCSRCHSTLSGDAKFCSNCGHKIRFVCINGQADNLHTDSFCFRCGTRLPWVGENAPATAAPPGQVTAHEGVKCPRCGSIDEADSAYCSQCGRIVDEFNVRVPTINAWPLRPRTSDLHAPNPNAAGFWIRAVAFVIDIVIVLLAVGLPVGLAVEDRGGFWDYSSLLALAVYFTVGVGVWGTTIGKKILGLQVIRTDGGQVDVGFALVRFMTYFVSMVVLFAGFIMIGAREDKRSLHDLVADTDVIKV
ncbi:MAG: RDD family protein [Chloroflexi bacterium]|nr:RDD family protein [Chloroflexota bacterium]